MGFELSTWVEFELRRIQTSSIKSPRYDGNAVRHLSGATDSSQDQRLNSTRGGGHLNSHGAS
jgi:hypothetical protein